MDIKDIRKIGEKLKKEIPLHLEELRKGDPVGKGASGDITYPVDKKAENIIFEEVDKLGIPLTIVSEEYGFKDIKGGGQKLLIDPIDGSKNALSGIPSYSSSIALIDGNTIREILIGYVLNLTTGDEFWAIKDYGTYLNGQPIKTQQDNVFNVITYETQSPRVDIPRIIPLLSLFNRTRCLGSTALDMAFLSQGAVSMFITPSPSRSFDFAAGYLLVKEAGGIVTDVQGRQIENVKIGVKRSTSLLSSANKELHRKALEVLRAS